MVGRMLTVARIKSLNKPGKHIDSNGLYLNISKSGSKAWIYRYQMHGIRREIGLGSFTHVSLREAREIAGDARKAQNSGQDPRTAIRIADQAQQLAETCLQDSSGPQQVIVRWPPRDD